MAPRSPSLHEPGQLNRVAEELTQLGLTIQPVPMNLRIKADVERAVADVVNQWGAIHILVNNAGISGLSRMTDTDDSKWYDIVDTNLHGMYLVTKAVLRHMPDQAGGRVINISSVLGKFGVPGYTAYCTTKHGMIGFSRALALEVVSRGITVNTICPGWVDTEMATRDQRNCQVARHHGGRIQSTSGRRSADPKVLGSRGDRRTGRLCRLGCRSRHHRTGDEYLRRSDHGVDSPSLAVSADAMQT